MVKRPSVNLAFDCTTFFCMSYGNELRQSILPILNYLCHATDMEAIGTIPTFFYVVVFGRDSNLSPNNGRKKYWKEIES